MNTHPNSLQRVLAAAQKPERYIIGLMSGTSLDGLDIAYCKLIGQGIETKAEVLHYTSVPYDNDFKLRIRQVFARGEVNLPYLTLLNAWVARVHAQYVREAMAEWQLSSSDVDLIASHGQTIMHTPWHQHRLAEFQHDATLQIGDGDHLAFLTGIPVISDFRQKHIAAGGEGAPLALYGDFILFSDPSENRVLLNLGGIANFTWLPLHKEGLVLNFYIKSALHTFSFEQEGDIRNVFSTDCGPANTLLDATVRKHFPDRRYDEGGKIAALGQVNQALLTALLDHPFFLLPLPKTTGPELFNALYLQTAQERSGTLDLSLPDLLATLSAFSAAGIIKVLNQLPENVPYTIYVSGGGQHNATLLQQIADQLPHNCSIKPLSTIGIDGDAKEALLFAVLANEWLCGTPITFGNPKTPAVRMGKLSLPD